MAIVSIQLTLNGPLALPNRGVLMGDALLHAAATRIRYPDAASRPPAVWEEMELPIRRVDTEAGWVYAASALTAPVVAHDTEMIYKRGDVSSGPLRAAMTRLSLVAVPYVEFFVDLGDHAVDALDPLLDQLLSLSVGFKTQIGFGKIVDIDFDVIDKPSAIVDETNTVLRPLPALFAQANGYQGVKRLHAIAPPYFHAPMIPCVTRDFFPIQVIPTKEAIAE